MLRRVGWVLIIAVCILITTFDVWKWCRTVIFKFTQMEKCTREGYLDASKTFDQEDMDVELWGRSFLITSASYGVGKSVASEIAERGGTVHLVCQNPDLAEKARKDIVTKSGNENIHVHILDMSDIASVHRFVQNFNLLEDKLDVLINNAGHVSLERTLTREGLEKSLAINVIASYVLTTGLLPSLQKSEDPRVVSVGSYCLLLEELRASDLNYSARTSSGHRAYCQQKRMQMVFAEELAKLHPRIQFSVVDPGFVTETQLPELVRNVEDRFRTPPEGADTITWVAVADVALMFENGLFYRDRQPISTHLPFGFTEEKSADRVALMEELTTISKQFKPK